MFKKNKIRIICISFLWLYLITGGVLYSLFGHQWIKAMYEGRSIGVLNRVIQEQNIHPLEYYYNSLDTYFFSLNYLFILFCIVVFMGFSRYRRKSDFIFYTIVAGHALFSIFFIIKTSVAINGVRYFTLFDDMMISMRYARNLVHGYGLVWNPGGERVDALTNFLWTIYMAFWHLFNIGSAKIALFIQLSGLFFLTGSLFLVRKIADYISGGNRYVSLGAVLLTASYKPINFWALKGMETSIVGFLVLVVAWRVIKCLSNKNFDPLIFVILGMGILIRIDVIYLFVMIALFMIVALPENRKKNAYFALSILLLVVTTTTLFRWIYYKNILPNTYYLKMTGVPLILRVLRGAWVTGLFLKEASVFLIALPFVYGILQFKNKKIWFFLYLFLIQLFYSVYVGGDAWEWWGHLANRFLSIVMPLFFILISLVVSHLIKGFDNRSDVVVSLKKWCFIILMSVIIIQLHHGFGGMVFRELINFKGPSVDSEKNMVRFGLKLKEITTSYAKIAVVWAGAIPYFSDRYCIDLLGPNDAFIARQKARVKDFRDFWPGENKYNYDYSIGVLKPDIVAQLWFESREAFVYLDKYYQAFKIDSHIIYCRKDSPNVIWAKLKNTDLN